MARHFAPKPFLRFTSNAYLERYFHEGGLLLDVDFSALDEMEVDPIYEAWQGLPAADRVRVDDELGNVDELATTEGIRTFVGQAAVVAAELDAVFANAGALHDKAILAFLDHPELFFRSLQFVQTDTLPERNWFKRRDLPEVFPRTDQDTKTELENNLKYYFTEAEGRGHSCDVECYQRDEFWYYYAYPEDYGGALIEWSDEGRKRSLHRPAFEIVFLVCPNQATLDIYYNGSVKTKRDLQTLFGRIVLGIELHPDRKSEQLYDLNRLKSRAFQFVFDRPTSGITDVTIHKLRFTGLGGIKRRVTLEADAARARFAAYDFLDDVFDSSPQTTAGKAPLPLAAFNVTQAQIRVKFYPLQGRRTPTRSFNLTYPNGCPLKYDGKDLTIRQMLLQSGLEIPSGSSPPRLI